MANGDCVDSLAGWPFSSPSPGRCRVDTDAALVSVDAQSLIVLETTFSMHVAVMERTAELTFGKR
jgi:hypothetical protein